MDTSRIQPVIDDCVPVLKGLAIGRYAITIGGSHGKGNFDEKSDVDFRIFCDEIAGASRYWETESWSIFARKVESWRLRGIYIDYCWVRTIGEIERNMDDWLAGKARPEEKEWSLWGYHLLTDIANQMVIQDSHNIIGSWKSRLSHFPPGLQNAIIKRHVRSLLYWRKDYHYANKVQRGDIVFLSGIASRLVHDMMQILFALNKMYYPGDGNNLIYASKFAIKPRDFCQRTHSALYPKPSPEMFLHQYNSIMDLIDDIVPLASLEQLRQSVIDK